MPSDREFRFVGDHHPMMALAKQAREECAGDPLFPVGAVLVRDGKVLVRAGNGYNRGAGTVHVCPRIVLDAPSGTGYDLCHLHDAPGHAEPMLIAAAKEQGIDPSGADVYMYGHWWCCEPCWNVMIASGVRDVYLLENAHVEFHRDRVYAQTLQSSIRRAYVQTFGHVCEELGCTIVDQIKNSDVYIVDVSSAVDEGELKQAKDLGKPIVLLSKKDSDVSKTVFENPAVVYHIQYEAVDDASRMLKNVLKQL